MRYPVITHDINRDIPEISSNWKPLSLYSVFGVSYHSFSTGNTLTPMYFP